MRPSCMTCRTTSQSLRIGARRDQEHGVPFVGKAGNQPVDLGLGADVDPACRFAQDQHARLRQEPLGEHDLLLVAAAQRGDDLLGPARLDAEALDESGGHGAQALEPEQASGRHEVQADHADVLRHRHAQNEPLLLAVVGHERQAPFDGGVRCRQRDGSAAHDDAAGGERQRSEEREPDFRVAGAGQAGKPDDLTRAQGQAHALEVRSGSSAPPRAAARRPPSACARSPARRRCGLSCGG